MHKSHGLQRRRTAAFARIRAEIVPIAQPAGRSTFQMPGPGTLERPTGCPAVPPALGAGTVGQCLMRNPGAVSPHGGLSDLHGYFLEWSMQAAPWPFRVPGARVWNVGTGPLAALGSASASNLPDWMLRQHFRDGAQAPGPESPQPGLMDSGLAPPKSAIADLGVRRRSRVNPRSVARPGMTAIGFEFWNCRTSTAAQ
jgi:hypothetical protein